MSTDGKGNSDDCKPMLGGLQYARSFDPVFCTLFALHAALRTAGGLRRRALRFGGRVGRCRVRLIEWEDVAAFAVGRKERDELDGINVADDVVLIADVVQHDVVAADGVKHAERINKSGAVIYEVKIQLFGRWEI